ncbi:hypothetical protein J4216_05590 [Candidatus Woesearchaeota archaeon]|nr:hypothetical protein [Candidatus Woesearchaeota archaeon]
MELPRKTVEGISYLFPIKIYHLKRYLPVNEENRIRRLNSDLNISRSMLIQTYDNFRGIFCDTWNGDEKPFDDEFELPDELDDAVYILEWSLNETGWFYEAKPEMDRRDLSEETKIAYDLFVERSRRILGINFPLSENFSVDWAMQAFSEDLEKFRWRYKR